MKRAVIEIWREGHAMRRRLPRLFLLIPVISLLFGCGDEGTRPEPTPASEEARLIALCVSGELQSPPRLAGEVEDHLSSIRAHFRNTCPYVDSVSFSPPWQPNAILIGVADTTATAIRQDRYHSWDALNHTYGAVEVRTHLDSPYPWVLLVFADMLHPRRLATLYDDLPGVRYTAPNGFLGDRSNIYPRMAGSQITYLFRRGSGDCPSGCIDNYYWYFAVGGDGPRLIGAWDGDRDHQPPWWAEARLNLEEYLRW
jgi:hypothetical protein